MTQRTPVEIADQKSRKRAGLLALAALVFLAHVIIRPLLAVPAAAEGARVDLWAINAALLLAVLATGGGGLLNRSEIRVLVNDEVSRTNQKSAVVAGFWAAMATAMGLLAWPGFQGLSARTAVYVIVSSGIVVALFAFSGLEYRAHRDA
jgi:hypothetical protein